ncbi:hypothetical protein PtB15_6B163 [Puccinia triticina]|nr:hypothetical protein PtB15_6B163 [Puccinia triticina]
MNTNEASADLSVFFTSEVNNQDNSEHTVQPVVLLSINDSARDSFNPDVPPDTDFTDDTFNFCSARPSKVTEPHITLKIHLFPVIHHQPHLNRVTYYFQQKPFTLTNQPHQKKQKCLTVALAKVPATAPAMPAKTTVVVTPVRFSTKGVQSPRESFMVSLTE